MADNTTLNAGTGGDVIGSDDISGVKYQRVKLISGDNGVNEGDASQNNPYPVSLHAYTSDFAPQYKADAAQGGNIDIMADPDGNLMVRGPMLTDEGSYRANFANTSLAVSLGSCVFTNGSATVTGAGFDTADLRRFDYVKLDADAESAWAQVDRLNSPTSLTLAAVYTGTGGTGASSRALLKPTTGSGGSIAVASGVCTLTSGTTNAATTKIERVVDWLPLVKQAGVTVSQRIANQTIYIALQNESATPKWFARFVLDGTTNTTVKCQSARNPTGAPSVAETEETTVTLPSGATTAAARRYRVEVLSDACKFFIDGVLLAQHFRGMPQPRDEMSSVISIVNGTGAASSTTVTVDYDTTINHNKLMVGTFSDSEAVDAAQPPALDLSYSVAGVITINTVLLQVDCSRLRQLSWQCSAMGTTGVVTPEWSNDGATWLGVTSVTQAGASATTFNAAGIWTVPVMARHFRLRLSTATTAGTTTLRLCGLQGTTLQPWLATQPVSGTVTANIGTGSLAAGTNAIGDFGVQYRANATGAATLANVSCPATPVAQAVKASAGRLLSLVLTNDAASTRWLKLWNTASGSVTLGTTAAIAEVAIPTKQTLTIQLDGGIAFSTAITMAITGGQGLTNNTAVTLGDVTGIAAYA